MTEEDKLLPKEFIRKIYVENLGQIISSGYYYIGFGLIGIGIEFIGKCIRFNQNKKWEENQKLLNRILDRLERMETKHDSHIGALGARWGLYSEASFRNGLKGILERHFAVEVLNVNEYDAEGVVFGRPDQIELDLIIKNGLLIIAEIKSSISKPEMYTFYRKVQFYEQRHHRKATQILVISPMVEEKAKVVAKTLGIGVYTHAADIEDMF